MAEIKAIGPHLEPVRKSIVVKRTPEDAFEIFTARLGSWWPKARFSLHQADTVDCRMEPRAGGAVYEIARNGERATWGTVLAWEPPRRLVMTWHPGYDPEKATEVEVRFVAIAEGTRVDLEHRNWIQLGAGAEEARKNYEGGWAHVFETRYREACS